MPIELICSCARLLKVKDELAGRRIRCPGCQKVLAVPRLESPSLERAAGDFFLEEVPKEQTLSPRQHEGLARPSEQIRSHQPPIPLPAPQPLPYSRPPEAIHLQRPPIPPPLYQPQPLQESFEAPLKRKKPRREKGRRKSSGGPSFAINKEIVGGLLMMGGAILWFVLGLAANRIFFYPPVLFVLGVGAIIRGFSGSE